MSSVMDKECETGVFNNYCSKIDITTIINYLEVYAEHKHYELGKNVQVVVDKMIDSNSYISLKVDDRNKIFNGGLDILRENTCYKLLPDFIDYNEEDYKDKEQYLAFYEKFYIDVHYDSSDYRNYYSICVYFKNTDGKVCASTTENKEQNIHEAKEIAEVEQSITIFADHNKNFLYRASNNMTISIYNIIEFIRIYAANIKYELSDYVQVVICALHHINNHILINDKDEEKARVGNLFIKFDDTTFKICSDFIDYDKNAHDREQYLSFYENFTIIMENNNRRIAFSVYFKNIPCSKKSNGYLNRIHMLKRENINTFPKVITSDYIISLIQEVMQNNKNIVSNNTIDVYLPYLESSLYMIDKKHSKIDHSINEGIHHIVDGVTYIFNGNLPKLFYYPGINMQKLNSLERDYNSIHVEVMRYSAIEDPIEVSGFEIFFREKI